jgi:prevent-host-death family protein
MAPPDSAQIATVGYMDAVPSRDLRNHTAAVLQRVARGEVVAVTVHGRTVAEIHPPRDRRPTAWTRDEFIRDVLPHQADPALRDELRALDELVDDRADPWA